MAEFNLGRVIGEQGNGIASARVSYQSGTSGTIVPTGEWTEYIVDVAQGDYLWTRTVITFTDSASTVAYSVARHGINGAFDPINIVDELDSTDSAKALSANMGRVLKDRIKYNTAGVYDIPSISLYKNTNYNTKIQLTGNYFGDVSIDDVLLEITVNYTVRYNELVAAAGESFVADVSNLFNYFPDHILTNILVVSNGFSTGGGPSSPLVSSTSGSTIKITNLYNNDAQLLDIRITLKYSSNVKSIESNTIDAPIIEQQMKIYNLRQQVLDRLIDENMTEQEKATVTSLQVKSKEQL